MTGGTSSAAGFDEVIAAPEKPRVCTLAGTSLPVYQWVMEMEEPYLRNSRILNQNRVIEITELFAA
jgi:hypothetical protein